MLAPTRDAASQWDLALQKGWWRPSQIMEENILFPFLRIFFSSCISLIEGRGRRRRNVPTPSKKRKKRNMITRSIFTHCTQIMAQVVRRFLRTPNFYGIKLSLKFGVRKVPPLLTSAFLSENEYTHFPKVRKPRH